METIELCIVNTPIAFTPRVKRNIAECRMDMSAVFAKPAEFKQYAPKLMAVPRLKHSWFGRSGDPHR